MKNNTLEIISTISLIDSSIRLPGLVDYSYWYLHGKLEEIFNYDKADVYKGFTKDDLMPTYNWDPADPKITGGLHLDGIYRVKVYDVDEEATGYFWTSSEIFDAKITTNSGNQIKYSSWRQHGLVVLNSDKEGVEFAERKFSERPNHL